MANKKKSEYPFRVIGFLPAGHILGEKKRDSQRRRIFRSEEAADIEVNAYKKMCIHCIKEKR